MSKQELLSWSSLGITISILVIYLLYIFGWPEAIPDYSSLIVKVFVNFFWIAFALELLIGIKESKAKVDKDERDVMIEAFSYKYAYNFVMVVLVLILGNLLLATLVGDSLQAFPITRLTEGVLLFHILLMTLLTASFIRRSSMIYYYRRMH